MSIRNEWQKPKDSNPNLTVLETAVLAVELDLYNGSGNKESNFAVFSL